MCVAVTRGMSASAISTASAPLACALATPSLTDPDIPIEQEAHSGTLITFEEDQNMEQAIISGIAFNRDEAKISVMGVPDKPGIAYAILGPVAAANLDVDMIVQNIGASGHTDFSFTVNRTEYAQTLAVRVLHKAFELEKAPA